MYFHVEWLLSSNIYVSDDDGAISSSVYLIKNLDDGHQTLLFLLRDQRFCLVEKKNKTKQKNKLPCI